MTEKISNYRPQRRNANKHNPRGMGLLQKSIESDGFIGAMTAAADGEIIAGSARLEKSAEVFGIDAEPIVIETDGTRPIIVKRTDIPNAEEPRAKRLALADNRVQEVDLTWDAEVLQGLAEFDGVDLGEWWHSGELVNMGLAEGQEVDYKELWQGMPEFEQDNLEGRKIIIHFENEFFLSDFIEKTGLKITDKTRSIWYPERPEELKNQLGIGFNYSE